MYLVLSAFISRLTSSLASIKVSGGGGGGGGGEEEGRGGGPIDRAGPFLKTIPN
jgi:hypothetical protein